MNDPFKFESLLVPVDFSPAGDSAFDRALTLARGDSPVLILLHVIDPSLVEFATTHGWGSKEDVAKQMRERAERDLQNYKNRADSRCEIDAIVSEHRERTNALDKENRVALRRGFRAILLETREAIKGVFTPEQAAEYQRLLDERDARAAAEREDRDDRNRRDGRK